jgi:hypothetical protein
MTQKLGTLLKAGELYERLLAKQPQADGQPATVSSPEEAAIEESQTVEERVASLPPGLQKRGATLVKLERIRELNKQEAQAVG